jgi:hypothetical protein
MPTIKLSKTQWEEMGKKAGWTKTAEKYLVVDNEFNRANYPDLVGKILDKPPSYAHVAPTSVLNKWLDEAFDLLSRVEKIMNVSGLNDIIPEIQAMQSKILSKKLK